ncbi:MAG: hypothetical protein AABX89_06385 [Candidatus Thermoplasmatota archaeon]
MAARLRVLVPVTGAFHGPIRLRRNGSVDTEGVERILSRESAQALALAKQLKATGAELVVVHVDKGGGEEVLREAMAHGADQGVLVEGAAAFESDASTRAATIADVVRQMGPFDAIVGPARSEFAGFTGTLAALAGLLEMPCAVGVSRVAPEGNALRISYQSLFGDYDLRIPRPSVLLAGDLEPSHPTAWGIHDAHRVKGLLRVKADNYTVQKALTKRLRIENVPQESRSLESVDGATLVRRLRSRSLIAEKGGGPS